MIKGIDCPYCGGQMENLDEVRGHHICDTCNYERDCEGDINVPDDCKEERIDGNSIIYWARCNYHINTDENELEPRATSMHECGNCDVLEQCIIKSEEEVWNFNSEIKDLIDKELKRMFR